MFGRLPHKAPATFLPTTMKHEHSIQLLRPTPVANAARLHTNGTTVPAVAVRRTDLVDGGRVVGIAAFDVTLVPLDVAEGYLAAQAQ